MLPKIKREKYPEAKGDLGLFITINNIEINKTIKKKYEFIKIKLCLLKLFLNIIIANNIKVETITISNIIELRYNDKNCSGKFIL
jgi:hypothetical protein